MVERGEEPEELKEWRRLMANPPRCCHNCEYLNLSGVCTKFSQTPPDEFKKTIGACPSWSIDVPF